jgi:xanthine dehydrogenase YagS FAD-binding subunit
MNREHAILHADRCVAVSPSDTAPALIALDATMEIRSRAGDRSVRAQDYFIGPATDITRMTVLRPDELLTAIRIPATWAGAEFYFEKVRDRQVWDFPLVNVASAMRVSGGTIQSVRIAVGAVAATPLRLEAVESAVTGRPRTRETAEMARGMAAAGAVPLRHNGYKVPLMSNLVMRAIRGAAAATT